MTKLTVSELFYSLQGEGLRLGTPSIFLRLFGCNLKCEGYGMPKGEKSKERLDVDPSKYKQYNDLPLVHTGCDSYASWDPKFKKLSKQLSVSEITQQMQSLLPNSKFSNQADLILTGGEPLLPGWQKRMIALFESCFDYYLDLRHITFETNGTQALTRELADYFYSYGSYEITFAISSKLPSSGESHEEAFVPSAVREYCRYSNNVFFKWVVSNPEDMEDALRYRDLWYKEGVNIPIYLMPAGGTNIGYDRNKLWVAEEALKNGFRFSPRLQVDLWKNRWSS